MYDSAYHQEMHWWTAPFEVSDGIPHDALVSAAESDRVAIGRTFPVTHHRERRLEVPEDRSTVVVISAADDTRRDVLGCGETLSAILLEATLAVHVVRPFSTRRATEIVSAPKVYAFDTGFVCYLRGWRDLREEDLGILWEHFVLNELHACLQTQSIHYWRDKNAHEVDFVLRGRGRSPDAIECKWSAAVFDPRNLIAFRRQYPNGRNWIVATDVDQAYTRELKGIKMQFVDLRSLVGQLDSTG